LGFLDFVVSNLLFLIFHALNQRELSTPYKQLVRFQEKDYDECVYICFHRGILKEAGLA